MKKLSKKWWKTAKLVLPPASAMVANQMPSWVSQAATAPESVRQMIAATVCASALRRGRPTDIDDGTIAHLGAGPLSPDVALKMAATL